ncbi:hypothetical protein SAY87_025041 [Trapa incisa]|nr:hypothetical protein SAY87_025041 [Trapa incisa]
MVYVLGIDKWRRVNTHVPLSAMFLFGFPTFVHGCIHWIGYRWNQYAIVAFDVHVEAFLEIGLPSEIVQASGYALIAHGESLCLLDNRYDRAPGAVPIWVMKQYGVKQSWFKQFNIEMHGYYFRVLGFWQHDNILLENNRREVVSYDPKVQSTKLVLASEEGMHLVPKYDLAIPYMECLVLLKGSDGLESHVDGSSSNI